MDKPRPSDHTPRKADATSLTLLQRARNRDATAWQGLVDLYGPLVFSWCQRTGLAVEDCRDLVQEIFAAVAANLDRFRRDRPGDTFRGWLRVIARNKIRDHFRRDTGTPRAAGGTSAQIRMQQVPDETCDAFDSVSDEDERSQLIRRGLELIREKFRDHTWQAFWLTVVEQRPPAEVSQQLQMTLPAIRQARHRVLYQLRAELGDLLE